VAGRRQRWPGSLAPVALVIVKCPPLWAVVDRAVLDDEPAVLAGRLDAVRVNDPATLRTDWAGLLPSGDVLVERRLVDISQ
jgi:hypothetical protein